MFHVAQKIAFFPLCRNTGITDSLQIHKNIEYVYKLHKQVETKWNILSGDFFSFKIAKNILHKIFLVSMAPGRNCFSVLSFSEKNTGKWFPLETCRLERPWDVLPLVAQIASRLRVCVSK